MKKKLLAALAAAAFSATLAHNAHSVVIDFTGGTAYLSNGTTQVMGTADPYLYNVDYYIEDGILIDFIGADGIIGNYYGAQQFGHPEIQNNVLHAHWGSLTEVRFTKVDGSLMDLNYMDLTSNTTTPGGLATGNELSYVYTGPHSMLLPSSDWGLGYISTGAPDNDATPIERLWLDTNFDQISSFSVTSQNAYCFGLDNFYIDEPPPIPEPEPSTILLFGTGVVGLAATLKKKTKAKM